MANRRAAAVLLGLGLAGSAQAGGGPWTLSPDDRSLYLGGGYTRWSNLASGDGSGNAVELESAVTRSEIGGEFTYGLVNGVEMDLRAAVAWAGVGTEDIGPCVAGVDCETTAGLTPVRARVKARLLDEFRAPLSLSTGAELRFGDYTRPARHRITALGDGQTDLGLFLSLGRGGGSCRWRTMILIELSASTTRNRLWPCSRRVLFTPARCST